MKPHAKTLDEFCGQPEGSFKKFSEQKEENLKRIEEARKTQIWECRNAAKDLSLAA